MIDVASAVSEENPLRYRWATYDGGHLDDQLWVLAMSTARYCDEVRRGIGGTWSTVDDSVLWHMIRRGVLDHSDEDKRWDSSTCAMRHSAIIGDQLWAMIDKECDRVSSLYPSLELVLITCDRAIVWSKN